MKPGPPKPKLQARTAALALLFACLWMPCAHAEDAPASEYFRAFAAVPGAVVTQLMFEGERVYQVEVRGVVLSEIRTGARVSTYAEDRTGRGAVHCAWFFNMLVRLSIDLCHPGEHRELREDVDAAVEAITDFIIANDPLHGSREVWRARAQVFDDERRRTTAAILSARPGRCPVPEDVMQRAARTTRDQRQQQLAHLLSVSRPPVMQPCLP